MATVMVASFTFISPVSSSMIAPASGNLAKEFGITSDIIVALTTSVFVLAYGTFLSQTISSSVEMDFLLVSYWPPIPRSPLRDIRTFACTTISESMVSRLELGLWICTKQSTAHRIPVFGGIRWKCTIEYWWRCTR